MEEIPSEPMDTSDNGNATIDTNVSIDVPMDIDAAETPTPESNVLSSSNQENDERVEENDKTEPLKEMPALVEEQPEEKASEVVGKPSQVSDNFIEITEPVLDSTKPVVNTAEAPATNTLSEVTAHEIKEETSVAVKEEEDDNIRSKGVESVDKDCPTSKEETVEAKTPSEHAESVEDVQEYIDETSQEELDGESIKEETTADPKDKEIDKSEPHVKEEINPDNANLESMLDSSSETPVGVEITSIPNESIEAEPHVKDKEINDPVDANLEGISSEPVNTGEKKTLLTSDNTQLETSDTQISASDIQQAAFDTLIAASDTQLSASDAQLATSDTQLEKSDTRAASSDTPVTSDDTQLSTPDSCVENKPDVQTLLKKTGAKTSSSIPNEPMNSEEVQIPLNTQLTKSDAHVENKHDVQSLLKKSESLKRYRKRHDPVISAAPLSLSKLYHLESETEFKGFLSEYYDSTILMYRAYWSYVQQEFGIQCRPLPKYKTNFYCAVPTQPLVLTSSGRVVKKKELKEFTPSVPSSQQIKREPLLTPKKESPVAKKEKKDPLVEETARQRYRAPLEKFGWKREVVFRSGHGDTKHSADVYYYSSTGKKLRSIREILDHLPESGELKPFHFTFVRELLGFGAPLEGSREAVARTLTGDEDTPKRAKLGGLGRKVFKAEPSKVLNGKVKRHSPPAAKRPHEVVEAQEDDGVDDHAAHKRSNGDGVLTSEVKKTVVRPLVRSPADVKQRKLSPGIKSPGDEKKRSTQSENKVPNALVSKHKTDLPKSPSGKKRKLEHHAPIVRTTSVPLARVPYSNKNIVNDVSNQFNAIVHLCKYLRVEDLLRVARINRMFNAAAHCHQLWHSVKLKNSKVRDWDGLADCLTRHGTHTLDMLKMIGSTDPDENDEIWNRFYKVIGKCHSLRRLELGRVTAAEILNAASNCSKNLTEFSVIAQKLATIDLKLFQGLPNLEILQLRSFESKREHGLIMMNITMLAQMRNLRHLSLTGVKNLKSYQVNVFKDFPPLASLELGDCAKLDDRFPEASLAHMTSLERLRLEMVQGSMANKFVEVIATLPRLRTLELINIDTKKGFDEMFARLSRVEHLLIFPTYITQSSTTNWLVLSGLGRLKSTLRFLTWGLTQELLRVTTLFIEQWNAQLNLDDGVSKLDPEELKKTIVESNSIPVMKPLPELFEKVHSAGKSDGTGKQNISELDILPIDELKTMLEKVMCDTKIKLITVPVSSTTRIYLPSN